jgi:hypothetical protein
MLSGHLVFDWYLDNQYHNLRVNKRWGVYGLLTFFVFKIKNYEELKEICKIKAG